MIKNATQRTSGRKKKFFPITRGGHEKLDLNRGQRYIAVTAFVILMLLSGLNLVTRHNIFDQNVVDFFVHHRTPAISALMLALTNAFTPTSIVIFAFAAALIFIFWRKSIKLGFALLGSVGISSVLAQVIKHMVSRHRPDLTFQLVHETDLSFPSGHATGIVALALAVYLAVRSLARKNSRRHQRRLAIVGWVLGILATLVCLSRLYLAAHWATDVIAGACLGLGTTYVCFWLTEKIFARG